MARNPSRSSTRGSGSSLHLLRKPSATLSSSMSNPRSRLAFERVGLAIGVTVDGHDHPGGRDGARRERGVRPTGHDRPRHRLARRHADAGEDAETGRADDDGDRERPDRGPVPIGQRPDHPEGKRADEGSDDPTDEPGERGVAHGRRRTRVAEHRSGADAESETDGDDGHGEERGIAVATLNRGRRVGLGLGHGGDANGSTASREAHARTETRVTKRNRRSVITCGGNGRPKASGPRR